MSLESEMIVSLEKNKEAILEVLLGFYRKEDWDLIAFRFRKIYWEFASLSKERYTWYKENAKILTLEYLKAWYSFLQEKCIMQKLEHALQRQLEFDPKKEFFEYDTISNFRDKKQKYQKMLKNSLIQNLPEFQKINARFKEKFGNYLSLEEMYGFYLPDFAHCVTWLHKDFSIIYFPIFRLLNRSVNIEKSVIHEIIHGVEYGEATSGINGPNRIYNLANEVRVDFLAYSVLSECYKQNVHIFDCLLERQKDSTEKESEISYKILFPLIEDFLSVHQEFINTCAVHNDIDTLIHVLGPEFKDFNDMLKEKLNWLLKIRRDTGETPLIEPTEESRKLVKTLSQNYEERFFGYPRYK